MFALIGWIYRLFSGIIPLNCAVIVAGYRECDTISMSRFLAYLQSNVTLGPIYFVANSIAAEAAFRRSGRGILLVGTNADGEWSAYQQALDEACLPQRHHERRVDPERYGPDAPQFFMCPLSLLVTSFAPQRRTQRFACSNER